MVMPTVGSEITRLAELMTGTWRGEETLSPSPWDPQGGAAFGTWTVRADLDGFAVIVDYVEEREGKVAYRGHGVHSWDGRARAFVCHWFDNVGAVQKPTHGALDGAKYSYTVDGSSRMTYEWSSDASARTMTFTIERTDDNGATWKPFHVGRYTRA